MKQTKSQKWMNIGFFMLLLLGASAVTLILFHRQTLGSPESYHSDMKAYILEMQGLDSGYSFPYPVFFKFAAFLHLFVGPEFAVALAAMLSNSLAMVIVKLILDHLLLADLQAFFAKQKRLAGALLSLLSISL